MANKYLHLADVAAAGETLWSHCWSVLRRNFLATASTLDKGPIGEISAQGLCLMAIDMAARRPLSQIDVKNAENQTIAFGNFVHLADFARSLIDPGHVEDIGQWTTMTEQLDSQDAWINAVRFTKASNALNALSLPAAFLRHEAIALEETTPDYDLIVPVYCGSVAEPHEMAAYTVVAIQAKARKGSEKRFLRDLSIPGLTLARPPLYISLETRDTVPDGVKTQLEVSVARSSLGEVTAMRVRNRSFDPAHFPPLSKAMAPSKSSSFALLPRLALTPPEGLPAKGWALLDNMLSEDWLRTALQEE